MKSISANIKRVAAFIVAVMALSGCVRRVQYTTVEIKDPVRHYYPILQGQELTVMVRLNNTGKVPLVIKDIQPSCGCIILVSDHEMVVPPERFMFVTMKYDSRKNVGKAEHAIRFWGNISPSGMAEMRFDVNVVPDASYHHDYEELFDKTESAKRLRDFVDGTGSETGLGYYVDR